MTLKSLPRPTKEQKVIQMLLCQELGYDWHACHLELIDW